MNEFAHIKQSNTGPVLLDRAAIEAMVAASALPCDGRVELIEGVLEEMAPANDPHADAHADLTIAIGTSLSRDYRVKNDPITYFGDRSMTGPDILILPRGVSTKDVEPQSICLLIEISDTTLDKDLTRKASIYGKHGAPEYWVVDLVNHKLHIHRVPSDVGYDSIDVLDWTTPVRPLFDPKLELMLAELIDIP